MAQVTNAVPERTVKPLADAILQAIQAGHVSHDVEKVTISAKTSPTKKDESKEFDAFYALDAVGMSVLCGGKLVPQTAAPAEGKDTRTDEEKRLGACDHFNYGRILQVRQQVRAQLESEIEGPEKTIDKQVKALVAGGSFDSEQEAREFVVGQLKKKGAIPADYAYPGASETVSE